MGEILTSGKENEIGAKIGWVILVQRKERSKLMK